MNMPVAKGWPCGAAMSCAKGELWKGDVGDYERKPTDLYSPSEHLRDRGTGERWRHGQQVDACNHPQCVEDRRELAAARVTLAEKRLELARLRTALRAVADELAGGDHRLGLATQSIQLALMEILDEVGGDDAATGAGGGPVEGGGGSCSI